MRAYAIVRMIGGEPDLGNLRPGIDFVHCGTQTDSDKTTWGAYILSGAEANVNAVLALSHVYPLGTMRGKPEDLDAKIATNYRGRLNSWMATRGLTPPIAANASAKEAVSATFAKLCKYFVFEGNWIGDREYPENAERAEPVVVKAEIASTKPSEPTNMETGSDSGGSGARNGSHSVVKGQRRSRRLPTGG